MLIRLMDALSDDRTKRFDALILPIPTGRRFLKNCDISHDSLSDDNIVLINLYIRVHTVQISVNFIPRVTK